MKPARERGMWFRFPKAYSKDGIFSNRKQNKPAVCIVSENRPEVLR